MGLREQARRPLLGVLLVALPFVFITRAIAKTEATPRLIGLPGDGHALTTMRDVHGADMAAITIAFLAGLCGVFIMNSARRVDRRLVVAGFRPLQALVPRLATGRRPGAVLAAKRRVLRATRSRPSSSRSSDVGPASSRSTLIRLPKPQR